MWKILLKVRENLGLIYLTLPLTILANISFNSFLSVDFFKCSERAEINGHGTASQRHLSNWVNEDEDDDDDEDQGEDSEPYVQATPPYCKEHY